MSEQHPARPSRLRPIIACAAGMLLAAGPGYAAPDQEWTGIGPGGASPYARPWSTITVDRVKGRLIGGGTHAQVMVYGDPGLSEPPVANDDTGYSVGSKACEATPTPLFIAASENDSDPEGGLNPATLVITVGPDNGTAEADADGTITYTREANADASNVDDTLEYEIGDVAGQTDTATVTIHINAQPTVGADTAATVDLDGIDSIAVGLAALSDPEDGTPLGLVEAADPVYGSVSVENGDFPSITYEQPGTPSLNAPQEVLVDYTVTDSDGCKSEPGTLTVTLNQRPVASNDTMETESQQDVTIDVTANDTDPENDLDTGTIEIDAENRPDNGIAAVIGNGSITYTPDAGFHGTDIFGYTIADRNGFRSLPATVSVQVHGEPIARDDVYEIGLDQATTLAVLDNDEDPNGDIEPNSLAVLTNPMNGSVEVSDGSVTYTPDPGFAGDDQFGYVVSDQGNRTSNVATVSITVVNNPPNAIDDEVVTAFGSAIEIDVVANDTDEDGNLDTASVEIATDPEQGQASVDGGGSGTVTYVPDPDFSGEDTFTYTIADEAGARSNPATITVSVGPEPDGPIARDDVYEIGLDQAATLSVLDNDEDPNGDIEPNSLAVLTNPVNGSVEVSGGSVTYTPDPGFAGDDQFDYVVSDQGNRTSNVATVSITVVNNPPNAIDDEVVTAFGSAIEIDVVANDTDEDGNLDTASVEIATDPEQGQASVDGGGSGTVTYVPDPDFSGEDTFTYTIADEAGARSNPATITVSVAPEPDGDGNSDGSADDDDSDRPSGGAGAVAPSLLGLLLILNGLNIRARRRRSGVRLG